MQKSRILNTNVGAEIFWNAIEHIGLVMEHAEISWIIFVMKIMIFFDVWTYAFLSKCYADSKFIMPEILYKTIGTFSTTRTRERVHPPVSSPRWQHIPKTSGQNKWLTSFRQTTSMKAFNLGQHRNKRKRFKKTCSNIALWPKMATDWPSPPNPVLSFGTNPQPNILCSSLNRISRAQTRQSKGSHVLTNFQRQKQASLSLPSWKYLEICMTRNWFFSEILHQIKSD